MICADHFQVTVRRPMAPLEVGTEAVTAAVTEIPIPARKQALGGDRVVRLLSGPDFLFFSFLLFSSTVLAHKNGHSTLPERQVLSPSGQAPNRLFIGTA